MYSKLTNMKCDFCKNSFIPTKSQWYKRKELYRNICCSKGCAKKIFEQKRNIRFESKFIRKDINECWEWQATKLPSGYGSFARNDNKKGNFYAHRYSYELYVGEILADKYVCHKCDNPSCVNPSHLFLATQKDNIKDMLNKNRGRWRNNLIKNCGLLD